MRHLLIGVTAAASIAIIGPLWAQVPPPATYLAQRYPFPAPTPSDAYRQRLINRWELERLEGPTPQALQGPSVDGGDRGRGN
jgi:hypothetical protein